MTALAQEILNNFDKLPNIEQRKIALEIFRRIAHFDSLPLTDEDLSLNAEELFLALDQQESDYD
ncbi:hypothetical protein KQ311_14260 [Synechocystis sp. CS-94]|nr:hypothetical protein D082_10710 [Synechocystis sp. PCC 6714]MCT0254965.1 hypothetical protein [Synechocystis sp. CS-94]